MSKFFDALISHHVENNNPGVMDVKLYSLRQVIELMTKAREMERASIEKERQVNRNDDNFFEILKGRSAEKNPLSWKMPSKFIKGTEEEVFGSRPIKNQWNDTVAICKENVENAIVILLNRGHQTATVREIVDVIKQFVPDAFVKGKKMIDYRHQVTKRFLSSQKKLLGLYGSVMHKGSYVFTIV